MSRARGRWAVSGIDEEVEYQRFGRARASATKPAAVAGQLGAAALEL